MMRFPNKYALVLPAAALSFLATPAAADTLHILFQGDGAQGDVDGVAFAGADWAIEVDVDATTADTNPQPGFAQYPGVIGARISIDGTLYELGGASATGWLRLDDISKYQDQVGDRADFSPDSGGSVLFLSGDDVLYPTVFGDNNDLGTAVIGATGTNATTDAYNNSSSLSLEAFPCEEYGFEPEECAEEFESEFNELTAASGEVISISAGSGPTGTWSVSVTDISTLAPPAPEPIVCDGVLYTGADMLAEPSVYFPSRTPSASGTSVRFDAGVGNSTLVEIPLFAAGELAADSYVSVSATVNRTRLGLDDDLDVVVTDGVDGIGVAAQDNNGGMLIGYHLGFDGASYSFLDETTLSSGGAPLPDVGGVTEYGLGTTLSCDSTDVSGHWGDQSGAASFPAGLYREDGLNLAIVGEGGEEAYEINWVCISTEVVSFQDACSLCPAGNCTDTDGDGIEDSVDNCPDVANPDQADTDLDGVADACGDICPLDFYNDSDGDGSCDSDDVCPLDADDDADADGICADLDLCPLDPDDDLDLDGICGDVDVCPLDDANDADGDGVCGNEESCPGGDDNLDADLDGTADFCDVCPLDAANDADNDGLCGDVDACPFDADNDADGDGLCGDVDLCPLDPDNDLDGDAVCGDVDPCPLDLENDADGDGLCEIDDNCPTVVNGGQSDVDLDGIGDVCDVDNDNDGVENDVDNCPLDFNPDQGDFDADFIGDVCDADTDDDGIIDVDDVCLGTAAGDAVLESGCSVTQVCPCDGDWKNHGAYEKCVSITLRDLRKEGLISGQQARDLREASTDNQCGRTGRGRSHHDGDAGHDFEDESDHQCRDRGHRHGRSRHGRN